MSNTSADVTVLCSDNDDGSADFTVSFAEDDHKFSAWTEGDEAVVQYEETLSWRGSIHVSEPDPDIYKALMLSEEMTGWMESYGLTNVRRERNP